MNGSSILVDRGDTPRATPRNIKSCLPRTQSVVYSEMRKLLSLTPQEHMYIEVCIHFRRSITPRVRRIGSFSLQV